MNESTKFQDGISLYNKRDYNGALTFFLSLPEDQEIDNIDLAYYIGLCYARLNRNEDALLYLEQVVTSGNVENPRRRTLREERILQCRYILSVIYALSGRRKLAQLELTKLLEANFRPANVYASLAFCAWEDGMVEASINFYKKAIEIDSDNVTALNGLGYVLACENRDLTTALMYCKKALSLNPASAACLDSLGWVYLKLGLMSDSVRYLMQAKQLLPENPEIAEHLRLAQEI